MKFHGILILQTALAAPSIPGMLSLGKGFAPALLLYADRMRKGVGPLFCCTPSGIKHV
jgi:hypothetical protein